MIERKKIQTVLINGKKQELLPLVEGRSKKHYLNCDFLIEDSDSCEFEDIQKLRGKDLPNLVCFNVNCENEKYEHLGNLLIGRKNNYVEVSATIFFDLIDWSESITPHKIIEIVTKNSEALGLTIKEPGYIEGETLFLTFFIEFDINVIVEQPIDTICEKLARLHNEINDIVNTLTSISIRLDLTKEQKFAYSQYLAYFGQFLSDIGIESETSVITKSDYIILSVSPKNKKEAVSNIHRALASYLELPIDPSILHNRSNQQSKKYEQLMLVITNLQQQLSLTQATLIESKEREIALLKTVTIKNEKSTKQDDYKVLGGLITLKKFKGKYYDIDLPKVARAIEQRLTNQSSRPPSASAD